ncbi:MAG: hypothetical protein H7Y19_05525 [Luteimonas sp.]|nr:hypothetical protein [Luteimonas sp.]
MRVIVLPGLDGTGELLDAFAAALAPEFDAQIIPYPRDRMLGYADLTQLVIAAMPRNEPFLLVAESFSGPIALRVAATRPPLALARSLPPFSKGAKAVSTTKHPRQCTGHRPAKPRQ